MDKNKIEYKRRKELRQCKRLANELLSRNIEARKISANSWESKIYEKNIKKLTELLTNLNQLDKDWNTKIYAENEIKSFNSFKTDTGTITDHPDVRKLLNEAEISSYKFMIKRYSPEFSIENDLFWIKDGTVGDQINIIQGTKTVDYYSKFLINKVRDLKSNLLKYLKSKSELDSFAIVLRSGINLTRKSNYCSANILYLTLIEGIVRFICKKVYMNQNPELSESEADEYIYN